ncbi:MAG: hypothetical protein ACREEM_24770 [Blastocatellia bacterium]
MNSNSNEIPIDRQPADAKPARFVISAEIDGFPVVIEVEGKADCLKSLVERLKAIGAQPPQAKSGDEPSNAKAGVPLCPVHGSPMKASRKPGKFYCAKKADDGEYCRETA